MRLLPWTSHGKRAFPGLDCTVSTRDHITTSFVNCNGKTWYWHIAESANTKRICSPSIRISIKVMRKASIGPPLQSFSLPYGSQRSSKSSRPGSERRYLGNFDSIKHHANAKKIEISLQLPLPAEFPGPPTV